MDYYSTEYLSGVVAALPPDTSQWLLNRYFTQEFTSGAEAIDFDVATTRRRITPFVSPLMAGKLVLRRGYTTNTFKPAYAKDLRQITPQEGFKRRIGEPFGGFLSPSDRIEQTITTELEDQDAMLNRRFEVMAAQALFTGTETITGDQFDTVVVSFGRPSGQTVVLSGGSRWGQSGIDPLANLRTWANTGYQNAGAYMRDVVMTQDAFDIFVASTVVQARLQAFRPINITVPPPDSPDEIGGVYQFTIDKFDIYTYTGDYLDDQTNATTPILPAGSVLMAAPTFVQGVRMFGAIRDLDAGPNGLAALPKFTKSWKIPDPSQQMLLMQSAPLMVPYRPQATFGATVL